MFSNRPPGISDDDARRAALKIVYPLPDCNKSWFGGTVEKCDRAQEQLDAKRKQYKDFEPSWMRRYIMHWLDFSQNQINEAREDCKTQKSRRELDETNKRWDEERRRADAIVESLRAK